MHKKRLLKLADFLETVPPASFRIESWVDRHATKPEGERPGECGFAGCAVGWAIHAKLFRGLKLGGSLGNMPVFGGAENWSAVSSVFGLTDRDRWEPSRETRHLFYYAAYPGGRATPKQVAKRIRKFVESGTIP